ncbi:hypothetical protein [Bacillus thuringiensis]|uniref:hypothetical protein n=1 Tax=Bacillus thuringiensis TaxID=1428 RepID=UPI003985FC45
MPYLDDHGFGGGGSLNLRRVINAFIQKTEPLTKVKGDIWIKSDITATKVLFLEQGVEAPQEEGTVWVVLKELEMKIIIEKIVKVFSNKKEINMNYSNNIGINQISASKYQVFRNKLMQIYALFGIAKIFRNGKWEWLVADYWDGTKWVNFSNTEFYVYYATSNGKAGNDMSSSLKKASVYDGSQIWRYIESKDIDSLAVDAEGFVIFGTKYRGTYRLRPDGSLEWSNPWNSASAYRTQIVAADRDGNFYDDRSGPEIVKRNKQNQEVWRTGFTSINLPSVHGIILDKDKNLYVKIIPQETNVRARIVKLNSSGTEIYNLPITDMGDTTELAMNDSYLFIGTVNSAVIRVSKDGKEIKVLNIGVFSSVVSLAADSKDLYLALRSGVAKYDQNMNRIWHCQFADKSAAVLVRVTKDGYIYAACENKTLKKIAPDGREVWSVQEEEQIISLAVSEAPYATFADLW